MGAIYRREVRSCFKTPLGYVFSAVFLMAAGALFYMYTFHNQLSSAKPADLGSYFVTLITIMMILIPLLTMKTFADEKKIGTEQLLLTAPVSLESIVAAKFCAAYTVFAGTFLFSCVNLVAIRLYGTPNNGVIIGYIIGLLLVGAAFTSIGIFFSSITENQITAAVLSIGFIFLMISANSLNDSITWGWLRTALNWISVNRRFANFTYGLFDLSSAVYYISVAAVFLFLTVRVIERRRYA